MTSSCRASSSWPSRDSSFVGQISLKTRAVFCPPSSPQTCAAFLISFPTYIRPGKCIIPERHNQTRRHREANFRGVGRSFPVEPAEAKDSFVGMMSAGTGLKLNGFASRDGPPSAASIRLPYRLGHQWKQGRISLYPLTLSLLTLHNSTWIDTAL